MKKFQLSKTQQDARNCLHHRGEMVLIDRILECSTLDILTQSKIREDNLFLKRLNNKLVFPIYQGIELIAQSLGCYQRINQSILHGEEKSKIGFLLSARNFEIFMPYAEVGETLLTQVTLTLQNENGFGVCEGKIYFNNLKQSNLACQSSISVLSPKREEWRKEKE